MAGALILRCGKSGVTEGVTHRIWREGKLDWLSLNRGCGLHCARPSRSPFAICAQRVASIVDNRQAQSSAVEQQNRRFEAWDRPILEPNRGVHDQSAIVNALSKQSQCRIRRVDQLTRLLDSRPG